MFGSLVLMAGFVVLGALSLAGIAMIISTLTRTNDIDERLVRLEELWEDSGRHERKENP